MRRILSHCCRALPRSWRGPRRRLTPSKQVFVEGLSELTAAIAGTFGDEGARIGPALDKMARGLAEWDRAIQAFEARLTSELPAASPPVAAQMRATLGRMYVGTGPARRRVARARRGQPARAAARRSSSASRLCSTRPHRSAEAGEAFRAALGRWTRATRSRPTTSSVTAPSRLRRRPAVTTRRVHVRPCRRRIDGSSRTSARPKAAPFSRIDPLQEAARRTLVIPPAAYARGYALISRGEYSEAIAEFRRAAAIDPLLTDPAAGSASMMQAVAALRQGRLADARALLESAPGLRDSSEAHRVLGLIYWADSQHDKSIEQLEIAIQRNPRDERSRLALARVLSSAGRDADAERALQETIQRPPRFGAGATGGLARAFSVSIDLRTRARNSNGLRQRRSPAAASSMRRSVSSPRPRPIFPAPSTRSRARSPNVPTTGLRKELAERAPAAGPRGRGVRGVRRRRCSSIRRMPTPMPASARFI